MVLVPYYDISTARIDMLAIDNTTQNTTHKKKPDTTWCRRHVRVSGRRVGKTRIDVFKINFWRHQKCWHFRLSLKKKSHSPFLLASPPSSKSLVDKGRFRQNGPASQHVRKEPTKNEFLVNFCFDLTALHLFSSDMPPSSISLVVHTKKVFPLP